ncbi:hypothetical protein ACVWYH_010247 [Bradyrhizobium sp. GM24.11]
MRPTSKFVAISAATALLCTGAAVWTLRSGEPVRTTAASGEIRPVWTETDWPFGADPWGKGKAFRCKADDCGGEVQLYVRAKLGFCNCATGVADDADLEQMGDLAADWQDNADRGWPRDHRRSDARPQPGLSCRGKSPRRALTRLQSAL